MNKDRLIRKNVGGGYFVNSSPFDSEHTALQRALELLYDYEETGLKPWEVERLKEDYEQNRRVLHKIASGEMKSIERLSKIVERTAERET